MKVGIIDYGVGNIGSISRAVELLRAQPILVDRAEDLHESNLLILPGVGNFTDCMQILDNNGWTNSIKREVLEFKKPILGICLGMQLLAEFGMEGSDDPVNGTPGLGLIPGRIVSLRSEGCSLRTPHVGWNSLNKITAANNLFMGITEGADFYFVHSYCFKAADKKFVIAESNYGVPFTAAVNSGKIWGTQFHPEKSSKAGLLVLKNFLNNLAC